MHIDYFWLVNLWLLSFLVAMMLYLKWTAPFSIVGTTLKAE